MTELAREYGDGLYALCAEETLAGDVLAQLAMLKQCFRDQPDFCRLLSNMALPKQERTQVVDRALRGQVHPYVLNFLKLLVEHGVISEFNGCEAAFRQRYNQDNGVVEAVVTTGAPMTDEESAQLIDKLSRMTGRQIQLTEKVDAGVISGVLLEMDGKRYDSTLRHRLEEIRRTLTAQD